MRCSQSQQLLHLHREGELPEGLRQRVIRHAERCPECAAELTLIRRTEGAFGELTRLAPVLHDPEGLTSAVMQKVAAGHARQHWTYLVTLTFASHRGLRLAAALLVCVFFTQTVIDAHKMSLLDDRLARVTAPAEEPLQSLLSRDDGTAEQLVGRNVSEAGLAELARALQVGPVGTTSMMDRFRAKYPELFSLSVEDGLDDHERVVLATEGRAFMKDVEQLISIAEVNHGH